jgi:hypothetical protein
MSLYRLCWFIYISLLHFVDKCVKLVKTQNLGHDCFLQHLYQPVIIPNHLASFMTQSVKDTLLLLY